MNRGIRRRRSSILAHVKLIVRSRGGTESVDRRVRAHVSGVEDLGRNGVVARGKLIPGALVRRARVVRGKAHRIAEPFARSLQETRGHRDLSGCLGQIAAHQHRLIDILLGEALHDYALARRAHGGVSSLGIDALSRLDAVDLLDGRKIVAGETIGRLHVDVIDILLVKVGVDRITQVLAARLKTAHHAHAERGNNHDRQKALKTASNRAVDTAAENRRHHIV